MGAPVVAVAREVLAAGPALPLSAADRQRVDALRRPEDRDAFLAARLLARTLLADHLGTTPREVRVSQVCERCGGPHGRPHVVGGGAHVGWTHGGGLVAVLVADAPCAVDLEVLVAGPSPAPPSDALTADERAWVAAQADPRRAFTELWVRKEVLVKLGGTTLGDLGGVDVLASLHDRPVLGRSLRPLETDRADVVGAWCVQAG